MSILGTLVVIVIRARNLPNRVRIGKQNAYAVIVCGPHKKRTKTIERGGQTPEWDEEFRFEIAEDGTDTVLIEESAQINKHGGVQPAKDASTTTATTRSYVPRVLKVSVYADDRIEPKLVGETSVDLDPIIQRGMNDEWHQLEAKGKFAGEVYMEMTWYSNAPPPDPTQQPDKPKRHSHRNAAAATPAPSSSSYGGRGIRSSVDDTNLLYGNDSIDDWDTEIKRPGTTIGVQSQSAVEIPSDYPDPDLAPLTSQASSSSRPPLPIAPLPPLSTPVPPPPRVSSANYSAFQHPVPPPPRLSSQPAQYDAVPQQAGYWSPQPPQSQSYSYAQPSPPIAAHDFAYSSPPSTSTSFVVPPPAPPSFEEWRAAQQQQHQHQALPHTCPYYAGPAPVQSMQYGQPYQQPRPPLPPAPMQHYYAATEPPAPPAAYPTSQAGYAGHVQTAGYPVPTPAYSVQQQQQQQYAYQPPYQ